MSQLPSHDAFGAIRSPGVPIILSEVVAELSDAASPQQIASFGFALGRRLAARLQLDQVAAIGDLEARLNRLWKELGLGECRLRAEAAALLVAHDPGSLRIDVLAPAARPFLLELVRGTCDACFRELGSTPSVQTTAHWNERIIELRHGN